ncbi:MAG TPA: phosphatidate cytidylyltransferase [Anaeromyxobacteraceae bacterium]|nr:phosphatidate cytidylyltransferase [Anaeromyxobacteraceae bacterium]
MSDWRRNLAVRVATGLVLFPVAVWITWVGGLALAVTCAAVAAEGAAELVLMFEKRLGLLGAAGVAVAGAFPLGAWLAWRHGGHQAPEWTGLALAFAVLALLSLAVFRPGPIEGAPRAMGVVALAWLYCGLLTSTLVGLRLHFGFGWVIMAFVVTWANDTFAYFAGRLFGRHKLLERVSPKKTWEGFAGGVLGSLAGALVVRALLLGQVPPWAALAVAAGGAALGPLGDLAESMLKRAAGVKDSGRLIPGHGGLLDRIDALLFVAPWVYAVAILLERLGHAVAAP